MKHTIVICEEIIRLSDFPSDNLSFVQDNKINPELFNEVVVLDSYELFNPTVLEQPTKPKQVLSIKVDIIIFFIVIHL